MRKAVDYKVDGYRAQLLLIKMFNAKTSGSLPGVFLGLRRGLVCIEAEEDDHAEVWREFNQDEIVRHDGYEILVGFSSPTQRKLAMGFLFGEYEGLHYRDVPDDAGGEGELYYLGLSGRPLLIDKVVKHIVSEFKRRSSTEVALRRCLKG